MLVGVLLLLVLYTVVGMPLAPTLTKPLFVPVELLELLELFELPEFELLFPEDAPARLKALFTGIVVTLFVDLTEACGVSTLIVTTLAP